MSMNGLRVAGIYHTTIFAMIPHVRPSLSPRRLFASGWKLQYRQQWRKAAREDLAIANAVQTLCNSTPATVFSLVDHSVDEFFRRVVICRDSLPRLALYSRSLPGIPLRGFCKRTVDLGRSVLEWVFWYDIEVQRRYRKEAVEFRLPSRTLSRVFNEDIDWIVPLQKSRLSVILARGGYILKEFKAILLGKKKLGLLFF